MRIENTRELLSRTDEQSNWMHVLLVGILLCSMLCYMSLASAASATDKAVEEEQEVAQAVHGLYQALSAKDAVAFARYIPEQGFSELNPDWRGTRQLSMAVFDRVFASDARIDLRVDEVKIQLLGETASVTGYRVGTIAATSSDQALAVKSRLALSMLWMKSKGGWKIHHVHLSNEA